MKEGIKRQAVQPKGWRLETSGYWYKCRVCKNDCSAHACAISSPNYAFYHLHCVGLSPSYQKAVKRDCSK